MPVVMRASDWVAAQPQHELSSQSDLETLIHPLPRAATLHAKGKSRQSLMDLFLPGICVYNTLSCAARSAGGSAPAQWYCFLNCPFVVWSGDKQGVNYDPTGLVCVVYTLQSTVYTAELSYKTIKYFLVCLVLQNFSKYRCYPSSAFKMDFSNYSIFFW